MINTNVRKVFEYALYDTDGLPSCNIVCFYLMPQNEQQNNVHKSLIRL